MLHPPVVKPVSHYKIFIQQADYNKKAIPCFQIFPGNGDRKVKLMINGGENGLSVNQKIPKYYLLNEAGDKWLSRRKIIGGSNTNLMELLPSKYTFAVDSFKKAQANQWCIENVDLSGEREEYESLSELEKKAFERIMCSLNSIESLVFSNYQVLIPYITAPEVSLSLSLIEYQASKHTFAYSRILESAMGADNAEGVYNLWRTTEELRRRNGSLNSRFMDFVNNPTSDNFLRDIVVTASADMIFLFTEFSLLYALARKGKLKKTAEVIKYINRDISIHSSFLVSTYIKLTEENPALPTVEFKKSQVNLIRDMVNMETDFVQSVSEGMIQGLSNLTLAKFSQSQSNKLLRGLKQDILYPGISGNPLPWFDSFTEVKQ